MKSMNIASCGLGINSIAGIIEATNRGVIFNEILFANTGNGTKYGERQATYAYLEIFNSWLRKRGQCEVKVLHSVNESGEAITLYEEMYKLKTLPAIVFGFKTCSQRFKIAPQDKYINNLPSAKAIWAKSEKVTKWIFYDADEPQRAKDYESDKYSIRYFLIENDFGRYECEQIINDAGLPLPTKSSCFYCPSMKPYEIIELYHSDPSNFWMAIDMERNALNGGRMNEIKGLGRDFSWWDLIVAYRYLGFIKRNLQSGMNLQPAMKRMLKKINNSKPKALTPKQSAKEMICDLFTVRADMPCGCYDQSAA